MNELVIKYAGGKMVLHLDKLFPRTKGWLTEFEKKVLRYCPDRDEVVEQMLDYLTRVKIPGLPEEARKLAGEIELAHANMLAYQVRSVEREGAEWEWRRLKSRQKRWPKYCELHDMNKEVLESWKPVLNTANPAGRGCPRTNAGG